MYLETRRDSFSLLREISPFKWLKLRKFFNNDFPEITVAHANWMDEVWLFWWGQEWVI